MSGKWVVSRYTRVMKIDENQWMIYNAYSGAIAVVGPDEGDEIRSILGSGGIGEPLSGLAAEWRDAGFLVPADTDELLQAKRLHDALKTEKSMHLVIMPTEACHFRCTYCYQTFPRGAMARETVEGLKAFVRRAVPRFEHLAISWFGGEPLLAFDTIAELSDSFLDSCIEHRVDYTADMATNGYLLTRERFAELLLRNVRRFMITLDGTEAVHDRRRMLAGGGGTFRTIIANLQRIRQVDASFTIDLRINFDEDNVKNVPELMEMLAEWFGGDRRFQILLRPVGRWGGPHNDQIPVCGRSAVDAHMWQLTEYGLQHGLAMSESIADALEPAGSVCYAAKPNSLVIGSDGRLYKCSIALDDEMNDVGKLHPDGNLELDAEKISWWTDSGEERDAVCRACFFRPACQGSHCPLYRKRTGKRPCPHEKRKIKQVLELIGKNIEQGR